MNVETSHCEDDDDDDDVDVDDDDDRDDSKVDSCYKLVRQKLGFK